MLDTAKGWRWAAWTALALVMGCSGDAEPLGSQQARADESEEGVAAGSVILTETLHADHMTLCFEAPLTVAKPWMADVMATFDLGGESLPHPFYYDGSGATWCANVNLPAGTYNLQVRFNGAVLPMSVATVTVPTGFNDDFVKYGPSLQQLEKGGVPFFPAGFNAQYGVNRIHEVPATYVDLDPRTHAALMKKMQAEGVYNYIRFNLSGKLNPMQGTASFGEFNQTAFENLDRIFELTDDYGFHTWTLFWHRGGNVDLPFVWPGQSVTLDDAEEWLLRWSLSPFHSLNGGPLGHPREMLGNAPMKAYFEAYLRTLVARYGWRSNWLAREFAAEVYLYDFVPEGNGVALDTWQKKLFDYMRSIDPYQQLVGTGDGGEPPDNQGADWADFHNAHIHPNPPVKPKVHSISGDPNALYAIYNHVDHLQTDNVDLNVKTYMNGSIGYGQYVRAHTNSLAKFMSRRTFADRHAYWEQLFLGAAGVGCAWDSDGALALHDAPALYAPVFRFAQDQNIAAEDFDRVNDLTTVPDTHTYAIALTNEHRSLAYLFSVENDCHLTAGGCPPRTASVTIPTEFVGSPSSLQIYDADSYAVLTPSIPPSVQPDGSVTVAGIPLNRAVAIAITP